jgi:hypothetical protein
MIKDKLPTMVPVPKVGSEYIILKTGEMVIWVGFNEETQEYEIKSPKGEIIKVHRRDIEIPTPKQEWDFLSKKSKPN